MCSFTYLPIMVAFSNIYTCWVPIYVKPPPPPMKHPFTDQTTIIKAFVKRNWNVLHLIVIAIQAKPSFVIFNPLIVFYKNFGPLHCASKSYTFVFYLPPIGAKRVWFVSCTEIQLCISTTGFLIPPSCYFCSHPRVSLYFLIDIVYNHYTVY